MEWATTFSFAIISGIIFIGFFGEVIFRRIGIPGVVFLLLAGYLLGPALGFLDVQFLQGMQFLINPLALIILTFGGGMQLNIYRLVHQSNRAILLAVITFALTVAAVAGIWVALGYNLMLGLILGAVLAGSASEIVGQIAPGLVMSPKGRQVMSLESSLTDVLSVIFVVLFTTMLIGQEVTVQGASKEIASFFSIGAILGIIFGMAWISMAAKMRKVKFSYMLTLAILLFLYIFSEYLGGSGAIAAIFFGVIFGNHAEIAKMLKFKEIHYEQLKEFHNEIAFVVRTFFFVYAGILITISSFYLLGVGIGLLAALIVARWVAVRIGLIGSKDLKDYKGKFTAVMPRGLATAVMATYPVMFLIESAPLLNKETFSRLYNEALLFPELAFVIIVASILLTSLWVFLIKKGEPPVEDMEEGEKKEGEEEEHEGPEEEAEGRPGEEEDYTL